MYTTREGNTEHPNNILTIGPSGAKASKVSHLNRKLWVNWICEKLTQNVSNAQQVQLAVDLEFWDPTGETSRRKTENLHTILLS